MNRSMLWHIIFYGWFLTEILVLVLTRTWRSRGAVRDRGSLPVLWLTILCSIWACEWISATHPHNMFGGARWLVTAAIVVMLVGLAIRWTAIFTLGKSFSANVAIHATQRVYKSGLYRLVRHPSYSGMLLAFLAVGLEARNWLSLAIVTVLPAAALMYRIHVEEAALSDAFGDEYVEYCRVTKRLVPGVY
jgi:protein-S-isoprenylcysteine O-methyltransferase Ste14